MTAWLNKLYETFIETGYYALLFEGLGNTLVITLGALAIGVVIGVLIAVIKYFAEDSPALKPQALRYILPAIGNELIALLKETAVAGYVAVVDLTRAGNLIRNNTYDAVNPLMIVALSYLAMVIFLTYVLKGFERRLNKDKH